MGKLLGWGAKKLAFGAGSVVLALVWMSMGGGGGGEYEELDRVPSAVFGGGAGEMTVDVKVSEPARLDASFGKWDESDEWLEKWAQESLDAGQHLRVVDVGPDTYFYFEVAIDEPSPGASIEWTVYLDGAEIWRESERLDQSLEEGYAFFVQFEADSVEDLRSWLEAQ